MAKQKQNKQNSGNKDNREQVCNKSNNTTVGNNRRRNGRNSKAARNNKSAKDAFIADQKLPEANDVNWYSKNAQLLKDVASIPFNNAVGVPIWDNDKNRDAACSVPGACILNYAPVPGVSRDITSPLNVCAQKTYAYVRHANSGHSNYGIPDLMLYILAVSECYAYVSWLTRIHSIALNYEVMNRYLPAALVRGMGVDYDDVITNLPALRAYINTLISKLKQFAIPNEFDFIKRQVWMAGNIYKDEDSAHAQYYLYNPIGFHYYEDIADEHGGKLTFESFESYALHSHVNFGEGLTVVELMNYGNRMITALTYSTAIGIMSGDILHAYQDSILSMSYVSEQDQLAISVNEEVLLQMHNWKDIGVISSKLNKYEDVCNFDITQDPNTNALLCIPTVLKKATTAANVSSVMINTHFTGVSPEAVMIATRMAATLNEYDDTKLCVFAAGSEIPVSQTYIYNSSPTDVPSFSTARFGTNFRIEIVSGTPIEKLTTDLRSIMRMVTLVSSFRHHPELSIFMSDKTTASPDEYRYGRVFEIDNYSIISEKNLYNIHQCALLSLFNIN